MRQLNREWRDKDAATDVLSFPQDGEAYADDPESLGEEPFLGDVVISMDTAQAQAKADDVTLHARVVDLLAHGILHLLGFDHEIGPNEARRMFAKQRALVRTVDERV